MTQIARAGLVSSGAMPLPKRPYVASADQVRIRRDGDDAIIEYADESVATTHLRVGAEKLASMTDDELLAFWNRRHRGQRGPPSEPELHGNGDPRRKAAGRVLRAGEPVDAKGARCSLPDPFGRRPSRQVLTSRFVSIDGRDFTLGEFMTMVGTFGGWGMRIEFVPDDELHQRPRLKVGEPDAKKGKRSFARRRNRS